MQNTEWCIIIDRFLKNGVILVCFKTDRNWDFLTDTLKIEFEKSSNISTFSSRIIVGT